MKNVSQVSKLTGISVRTLHHYDAIGLLKPTEKTQAGYRLYDNQAIKRLQIILMFRELEFPLKDIKEIMESPNYDQNAVITLQIKILEMKKAHLDRLIGFANNIISKGFDNMDFSVFNNDEVEQYKNEAKEKWGHTAEYGEYEKKNYTQSQEKILADGLMEKFSHFGKIKELPPESEEVQNSVSQLMNYISENFYPCTKEILSFLGDMYVSDERFRNNIDSFGGEGTSEFLKKAITIFCKK